MAVGKKKLFLYLLVHVLVDLKVIDGVEQTLVRYLSKCVQLLSKAEHQWAKQTPLCNTGLIEVTTLEESNVLHVHQLQCRVNSPVSYGTSLVCGKLLTCAPCWSNTAASQRAAQSVRTHVTYITINIIVLIIRILLLHIVNFDIQMFFMCPFSLYVACLFYIHLI